MRPWIFALLLAASSASAADTTAFGWVLEENGTWIDRATQNATVRKNYPVGADSRLICTDKNNKASYLVIKSRLNGNTKRFSCDDGITCDRELDLAPMLPAEDKIFPAFLFAFLTGRSGDVDRQFERLRLTLSRGTPFNEEPLLRETVVAVGSDLQSDELFAHAAKPGTYTLEFCPFPGKDSSGRCPPRRNPLTVVLPPTGVGSISTKNLDDGLYLAVRWDDGLRTPDRSLVWVAPLDQTVKARAQFMQARAALTNWSNERDAREYLRAFLLQLSTPVKE